MPGPSVENIGANISMSGSQVQRAIKKLEERGYLQTTVKADAAKRTGILCTFPMHLPSAKRMTTLSQKGDRPGLKRVTALSANIKKITYKINYTAFSKFARSNKSKGFPERGKFEAEVANLLGNDGWDILGSLPEHDLDRSAGCNCRTACPMKPCSHLKHSAEGGSTDTTEGIRGERQAGGQSVIACAAKHVVELHPQGGGGKSLGDRPFDPSPIGKKSRAKFSGKFFFATACRRPRVGFVHLECAANARHRRDRLGLGAVHFALLARAALMRSKYQPRMQKGKISVCKNAACGGFLWRGRVLATRYSHAFCPTNRREI